MAARSWVAALAAGRFELGGADLLVGVEGTLSNGPWVLDEELEKVNGLLKLSGDCWTGERRIPGAVAIVLGGGATYEFGSGFVGTLRLRHFGEAQLIKTTASARKRRPWSTWAPTTLARRPRRD